MKEDFEQMTDSELACSSASGSNAAFEQIVRRYIGMLSDFVAARTSTFADAEDIVQETFLRAFTNIHSYDKQYSLKNWLFTIAYRLVVSVYRKKRPVQLTVKAADRIATEPATESPEIDRLWQAAGKLSLQAYTILWLRYKQDMEIDEISGVMNISKVSVRVKLHRARKQLASQISQNPSEQAQANLNSPEKICIERTK